MAEEMPAQLTERILPSPVNPFREVLVLENACFEFVVPDEVVVLEPHQVGPVVRTVLK